MHGNLNMDAPSGNENDCSLITLIQRLMSSLCC